MVDTIRDQLISVVGVVVVARVAVGVDIIHVVRVAGVSRALPPVGASPSSLQPTL